MGDTPQTTDMPTSSDDMCQVKEQVAHMSRCVQEMGALLMQMIAGTASEWKQQASQAYGKGYDKACELEHATEEKIRHYPLMAVLISVLVGLVIGIFFRSADCSDKETE